MDYREELQKIYTAKAPDYSHLLGKEVFLYGAGSLGEMGSSLLLKAGIKPKYIVDKVKRGEINGLSVISPNDIPSTDKTNALCLVCIATISYNEIETALRALKIKNLLQFYTYAYLKFPYLLGNGWTYYYPTVNEQQEIEKVCEILSHDQQSLCHYLQFLWWKLRGVEYIYPDYPVLSGKKYFDAPCMPKLSNKEVLADVGCHYGQTIEKFIHATNNQFINIYAFEPDRSNLEICQKRFQDPRIIYSDKGISDQKGLKKFQAGLGYASKISEKGTQYTKVATIDEIEIVPTIIKLHIEGEELNALYGARKTIQKHSPLLMVFADHNSDGLYKIAKFIYEQGCYVLFFNLHDYSGNTAVFYAY